MSDNLSVHFVCSLDYLVSKMNTYFAVSCLLALTAVASANPPAAYPIFPIATIEKIPSSNYKFNYAVNDPSTGDNKAQWESRDGDVVHGAYSLVEPDGNIRLVEYTADPLSGFNAVVKRTGPNLHSVSLPIATPITPVITKPIASIGPIGHAPVGHGPIGLYDHGPIGHGPIGLYDHGPIGYGPIGLYDHGPIAPVAPIAQIVHEPVAQVAPIAPVIQTNSPVITPILEAAPLPTVDILPWWPAPQPSPWMSVSGTTYGAKGNIVRRWAAGPISMDGKTLTIKSKYH